MGPGRPRAVQARTMPRPARWRGQLCLTSVILPIRVEQRIPREYKKEACNVECAKISFICFLVSSRSPPALAMDWLSRLFEMMLVRGRVDLRCLYGAPWRIEQGPAEVGEIPYHAVVSGSALLDDPAGGRPLELKAGDIP